MCFSCVCSLLCKILSLVFSLLFIIAIVLIILWATGVIFVSEESNQNLNDIVRNTLKLGKGT